MFEDDSGLLALFSCEDTVFRVLLDARGGSCWRLFLLGFRVKGLGFRV
jgi:hypothetical protein